MMTLEQTVDIPASQTIEVPRTVPAGKTILTFTPAVEDPDIGIEDANEVGKCPQDHTPNAETAAAIREGRAMMRGEIPSPTFNSLEELLADLRS
jgi:hypothetical protein